MEQFTSVRGAAAPLIRLNVDTDQIIPSRFLGGTDARGYGKHLFADWRLLPDGNPNPEFILNQKPFSEAVVLLAGRNFGCGSSRERAPKALREFGIRAIIAPSFGGIFFNNCFRNGIVPVVLEADIVQLLADAVSASGGLTQVAVDLAERTVCVDDGACYSFDVPDALGTMLLQGIDEIDQTLSYLPEIEAFRASDAATRPWV